MRLAIIALLAPLALMSSACGIATADFSAGISFSADIDDPDNFYDDFVLFDPNDSEDFRDNRDKIEDGKIRRISVIISRVRGGHEASLGVGQIDVRAAPMDATEPPALQFLDNPEDDPNGPFITGIARWDPVALVQGQSFDLKLDQGELGEIHDLIFERGGPLEVRFVGLADKGPVNFTFDVDVELDFTARVP
ncbi:MAG: hypothetical protein AAGD10_16605 [Myxococcota bacterium]